jgi:hypothetical protein
MNRHQFFHGLQLDDHLLLDQEIDAKIGRNLMTLVLDGYSALPFASQSAQRQFHCQAFLINALQQSRSESAMHLNRRTNGCVSHCVLIHLRVSASSR